MPRRSIQYLDRIAAGFVLLALLGVMVFALQQVTGLSFDSGDGNAWTPKKSAERKIFDQFTERFGAQDMLLVSWPDCSAKSSDLTKFSALIMQRDLSDAEQENRPGYFESVIDYQSLKLSLDNGLVSPAELDQSLSEEVEGFLIGRKNDTGVILLEGSKYSVTHRPAALALVKSAARECFGDDKMLKFAGSNYLAVSASEATQKTLFKTGPVVAGLGFAVLLIMLRHWVMAILCFWVSGVAALLSMYGIHASGKALGDLLVIVPSLSQLLAMSNAIHIYHYYVEAHRETSDPKLAWRRAIKLGWLPTVTAAVSTIVGFAALSICDLGVASDFAVFGGLAVAISAVTVLIGMPAGLILLQPKPKPVARSETALIKFLDWLTWRNRWAITVLMSLIFVGAALGVSRLESDVRLESFFKKDSEFIANYNWFAEEFSAPTVSELMVSFSAKTDADGVADRFDTIKSLVENIKHSDSNYAVFSPMAFTSGVSDKLLELDTSIYMDLYEEIEVSGWVRADSHGEHWRISVRHPGAAVPEKSKFNQDILKIAADIEHAPNAPQAIELTGVHQLFSCSQNNLLKQMLKSFLLAFLIVTPLIVLFLKDLKMGVIAMLGNVFPMVIFFGGLGWLGFRIDIATMTIAAVAFGIAIDDTVHFLTWLSRGRREKKGAQHAVRFAFEHSAVAITQTTMVLSIGMVGYFFAEFGPSIRFGLSSAVVFILAMIGDLVYLPAIIRCVTCRDND